MREKRGKLAKTLNRDKVLELIKMTEDEYIEKGATINQMENVFKYFNIPVRLYNFNNEIIYRHDPATRTHTRIATFNALVKNNHIYTMNFDLKSLYQKNQIEEKSTVSQNYYLNDREAPVKYIAFDNIDELLKLTDEEEYYLIQVDNDLVKTLHQLKTAKYEPFIKYQSGMLSEIKVRFQYKQLKKTVLYNIVSQNLSKQSLHCEVIVKSSDKYNKMTEAMCYFNKSIFKETSKSKYSEIDVEILDECRTIVPIGYFDKEISLTKLTEIDRNKAFTSALCDITRIPVFNEFDIWMPYDNQDIKMMDALTLYIVEVNEGNIFFNKKCNLIYGKFLRKMVRKNINMKIHYYKQPHRFIKVDYEKAVNELWKQNISDDKDEDKMAKKTIANINIGLLEKSSNKHQDSKIFNSVREACYYQNLYGGKVYSISHHEEELVEDEDENIMRVSRETGDKYYILNISDSKKIMNGFRYIKELLLQHHNFKMYETYETLKANGVRVYSVKSDAFTIHSDDVDKVAGYTFCRRHVEGCLDVGSGIGQWKVEDNKTVIFPKDEYRYKFNTLIEIPKLKNDNIPIEDEWDTKSICERIIKVNEPVIIKAKYAGSGKSYIGEYFAQMNKNVLFVMPNNRQLQEKLCDGLEATTFNKFFSIAVDSEEKGKMPKFDYEMFDVIVFDEVFMVNTYTKNRIRVFCLENPDKIRILTGDTKQLPCFEDSTNCQDEEEYANRCIDIICPYNIYLTICKRVGEKDSIEGDKNRKIISDNYDDFWVYKLPLKDIIPKYVEITNDIMASEHNIAHRNIRCHNVANEIRQRLGKKDKYEVGEILIARKWVRNPRINMNIRYAITKIEGKKITLQNISIDTDRFIMDEEQVDEIFIYSHCATCHSTQGASIKGTLTIHEWDLNYVSREWLYTALTRCVDFKKVKFYQNKHFDEQ